MKKRLKLKAAGRRDHKQHVERVRESAVEVGLREVLRGIATDQKAGVWGEWAEQMLAGDRDPAESGRAV